MKLRYTLCLIYLLLLQGCSSEPVTPDEPSDDVCTSLILMGDAVEGGEMKMTHLGDSVYESFLRLDDGEYTIVGLYASGESVNFGNSSDGSFVMGGAPYAVSTPGIVRLRADFRSHTLSTQPITSLNVKGTIAPDGTTLDYAGFGVWESTIALDKPTEQQYSARNIYFNFNNDERLPVRRIAGTDSLVMGGGENIRLNNGVYRIKLDMNARRFEVGGEINPYRISVFGSSVANGQGADQFHGYTYLYGEQLKQRTADGLSRYPLHTSGVAIGGNNTYNLLNRYDDVIHDFGHFVILGLGLSNEGIHSGKDQQKVFEGFVANMKTLIEKLRADGKYPVVVNTYVRNSFDISDYSYVKQTNMLIHEWDVPSVNVLGTVDDGSGHWVEGLYADEYHPNDAGHAEMMTAIAPSLFDAIIAGKALPVRDLEKSYTLSDGATISLTPEGSIRSFTVNARVKGDAHGSILRLSPTDGASRPSVEVTENGYIVYNPMEGGSISSETTPLSDGEWHHIALTHFYPRGTTSLYVDGNLCGIVHEKLPLREISFGEADNASLSRHFSEISFWRSGMTQEEIAAVALGKMMKSSLEIYSPMDVNADGSIKNKAQTLNSLRLNSPK